MALKNGNGATIEPMEAMVKSVLNNAMKGDLAAIAFVRTLTAASDPERERQAQERHQARLATHPDDDPEGKALRHAIICQSNATNAELRECQKQWAAHSHGNCPAFLFYADINPLGPWTGGTDADSGATNRKLGSDMGDAVSGGGLHGKDLSKMDVTANIVCHMLAQRHHTPVECYCAIGDQSLTFRFPQPGDFPDNLPAHPHITMTVAEAVEMARLYILTDCGGSFERFAEWGLIRPNVEARADLQSDR